MIDTDAVVIGAGPVGLFQVFQLGLLGIKAEIIDVLPEAGGQCMALYPDKPIYDIPGVPVCTGRELTQQLLQQAAPFLLVDTGSSKATPRNLHLGQMVARLAPQATGGFVVETEEGPSFHAKAVFIAAGAGAFVPKTLSIPELQGAANLHYHLPSFDDHAEAAAWAGQHLVVSGGGDEALSAVASIMQAPAAQRPARLTLLHRRAQFQAEAPLAEAVQALIDQGAIELAVGMPTGTRIQNGRIEALSLLNADSATVELPLQHLLIRQGMSPKLGPLTNWGLALERKQLSVQAHSFETSVPGIYAIGDINTYPGKKRLLLCGFHEATLAAHHAAAALHPEAPQHLLYTTTSPLLHKRLGVAP
jgi:thioredoxin reductase (NADPH)